jgi:DNA (cytosine-5)-methyltransferase 1
MTLKVLSLFSGVGGFDLGLERATMETVYQCEIDKNCRAILDKHWPLVPKWDDITTLTGEEILSKTPIIDVVAWGSPCQDLSVAGKRAGLSGEKSNLFHEGIRIINQLRKATNGQYPAISIWENVAGALNSNGGNDFGVILDEMAKSGALVVEWGILDAQYFGIPQRRRRVFVVAIFNPRIAERCPDPLLPLGESLHRDIKTRRETRKNSSGDVKDGTKKASFIGSNIVGALCAADSKMISNQYVGDNKLVQELPIFFSDRRRDAPVVHDKTIPSLLSFMGTGGNNTPLLAFDTQFGSNANVTENISPTLKASQQSPSIAYSIREDAKANNFSAIELKNVNSLSALQPSPQSHHAQTFITERGATIRRLTPKECERLMGWPDDHTRWRADGKEQTDGHRYKQCGNGVASPVATWIGEQIVKVTN